MRASLTVLALLVAAAQLPAQNFFPPGVLGDDSKSHEFSASWYSKHLKALGEPSLWELSRLDPHAEVYRFLWLRTCDRPIAVRVAISAAGTARVTSRMTNGQGGYESGKLIRDVDVSLKAVVTRSFVAALDDAGFWKLQTLQSSDLVHLDGSQWIIEGVRNGKYHIVDRQSPGKSEPVRAIGHLVLKLGRFKIPARAVY